MVDRDGALPNDVTPDSGASLTPIERSIVTDDVAPWTPIARALDADDVASIGLDIDTQNTTVPNRGAVAVAVAVLCRFIFPWCVRAD